jgi:transmembrane sensor
MISPAGSVAAVASVPISIAPSYEILQQAAEWFALLRSEDATDADQRRWQVWLEAAAVHRDAWKRVEAVNAQFNLLPTAMTPDMLSRKGQQRRKLAGTLALLAMSAGLGGGLLGSRNGRNYLASFNADYRTGVGETSKQQLADGSTLWLNTSSAADVDYNGKLRRIVLRNGEILVRSAHDIQQPARPLVVDTVAGRLRALGTHFMVRPQDGAQGGTLLAVFEGAVQIEPADGGPARVIKAGSQAYFGADWIGEASPCDESIAAWSRNLLMPDGMRLDQFLAELGRYRRGYLACAPEVAGLKLVGVYPTNDTERVLNVLEASLPVRVRRIFPWWVTVEARPATN